jgi:hypothetical protein
MWTSERLPGGSAAQAAEPSDFDTDLVAVLVVPVLAAESDDGDEDESDDEPPDSPEELFPPEPDEPLPELLPERLLEPVPRRESLRESLR